MWSLINETNAMKYSYNSSGWEQMLRQLRDEIIPGYLRDKSLY